MHMEGFLRHRDLAQAHGNWNGMIEWFSGWFADRRPPLREARVLGRRGERVEQCLGSKQTSSVTKADKLIE